MGTTLNSQRRPYRTYEREILFTPGCGGQTAVCGLLAGRYYGAQAARGGTCDRKGGGRSGYKRQVRLPCQHEPRDPYANERHPRHDTPGSEDEVDTEADRLSDQNE